MFFVVEDECLILKYLMRQDNKHYAISAYHFIRHDEEVKLLSQGRYFLEFLASEYFTNRIVRSIDDNHLGTRSNSSSVLPS